MFRESGYRRHVKTCRCIKSKTICLKASTMSFNLQYEVLRDGKYSYNLYVF